MTSTMNPTKRMENTHNLSSIRCITLGVRIFAIYLDHWAGRGEGFEVVIVEVSPHTRERLIFCLHRIWELDLYSRLHWINLGWGSWFQDPQLNCLSTCPEIRKFHLSKYNDNRHGKKLQPSE
ncbi:uncharacterized protein PGTG_14892 [Puccinia graminis f. sp. tritici CRL 75-36-700-3]|uniref:Uncharacterized protein n=1 Tax=Puccinia graminis f. sp. tritici (strain CRL 75-36-700-3 / race SCCL) TaxID=418459 RepID=E3KXW5_PUCGT|nr:uncharacterized protein PGTG_14892 [Puccinia graminis f. sp. tritici CRL 75-36-700-3]EFP89051.1 hypothetical protein PGTG_14892 [Puccinia graminis f. sp. tritici CRL 75-36-700-3]